MRVRLRSGFGLEFTLRPLFRLLCVLVVQDIAEYQFSEVPYRVPSSSTNPNLNPNPNSENNPNLISSTSMDSGSSDTHFIVSSGNHRHDGPNANPNPNPNPNPNSNPNPNEPTSMSESDANSVVSDELGIHDDSQLDEIIE